MICLLNFIHTSILNALRKSIVYIYKPENSYSAAGRNRKADLDASKKELDSLSTFLNEDCDF